MAVVGGLKIWFDSTGTGWLDGVMSSGTVATQRPCFKHQVPGYDAWNQMSLGTRRT